MRFRDRHDAGRTLAAEPGVLAETRPVVLALPRGGVPVAYEIARTLGAPLDVLAVRKLGAPTNPEYAIGAVAEDGTGVVDERAAALAEMSGTSLRQTLEREAAELRRRIARYRGGRAVMPVGGRTVILVDDGVATGLTDLAAVRAARALGARRVVVAVPVGSPEAVRLLASEADEVICPHVPGDFRGVGLWYDDFSEVPDAEVIEVLARARTASPATESASNEGDTEGPELSGRAA